MKPQHALLRTIGILLAVAPLASCDRESENTGAPAAAAPAGPVSGENPLTSSGADLGDSDRPTTWETGGLDHDLVVEGVVMTIPGSWIRRSPSSSMRAAEYLVPHPEQPEAKTGTFALFRGIGGSVEENITRWIGQVTNKPEPPVRETIESDGGFTVHTVRMVGDFSVGPMMGGTGEVEQDTMMLGAVIVAPRTTLHLKVTGPRTSLEPQLASWDAMLRSVRAEDGASK